MNVWVYKAYGARILEFMYLLVLSYLLECLRKRSYPISEFIDLLIERVQAVLMIHIMPTFRIKIVEVLR